MKEDNYQEKLSHLSAEKRKLWEKEQLFVRNLIVEKD